MCDGDVKFLLQCGHMVRVQIDGISDLPAHVGFELRGRGYNRGYSMPFPIRGYTLDIEVAKGWIDMGGLASLRKVWQLPNGNLVPKDPAVCLPAYAWRPHQLGSAQP